MGKIIALDAGHGFYTSGKRCMKLLDSLETREWYLNDRIADIVEQMLSQYQCTVLRVNDTTGTTDTSLSARVKAANNAKADVYLSIHHNAGINGGSGGGTVIFYYSPSEARTVQAQNLYNHVVANTGLTGNRSSKVVKQAFYVLKNTNMPAFLLENGFMDSSTDVPVILTEVHAQKTADGIVNWLISEFELESSAVNKIDVENETCIYYPAYVGKATTLSSALASLKIDCTYTYRKKIAAVNNIIFYVGSASQNTQIYNLLKSGLLKRC